MAPSAMVGKRHALLAVLLILLCTSGLSARGRGRKQARDTGAPRFLEVNLATQDPSGSRKEPVEAASDVTIRITNRLPNGRYGVDVLRHVIEIPPFKMPAPATPGPPEFQSECESLVTASTAFENEKDERLIPSHVSKLNALIETASGCQAEIKKASLLIERTTEIVAQHVTLPEGMELVVRVQRLDPPPLKTWERTFSTGERGRWMTTYGFNFIPSREPRYFSSPSNTEVGKFTIEREENRRGLDFTPSVYFSWMATRMLLQNVAWGLTGGLGFDLSNPVIFVAPSLTYNWNLSFMAGLAMHKERRLRGRYGDGDTIGTNLTNEELTDESYRPAPFVGVAFRFGSNPFPASAPGGVVGNPTATRTQTQGTPTPTASPTPTTKPT